MHSIGKFIVLFIVLKRWVCQLPLSILSRCTCLCPFHSSIHFILYHLTNFLTTRYDLIFLQRTNHKQRHTQLGEVLSAILAIQSMVLLGFADDVLDVRWRYKVWFPALAGVPLLMFYYTNGGGTSIVMPMQLRPYFGKIVDLGKICLERKRSC